MEEKRLVADSASPLYRQLMLRLREDIAQGVYPPRSRIPSEQELCNSYQVSRVTVRKALSELTREGLLRRMQGKGTFVCAPRIQSDLHHVTSFTDACRAMGAVASTRLIQAHLTAPEPDVREKLQLTEAQAVEIVRLRLADDQPVMLEVNCFPLRYESLLREDLTTSLYDMLHRRDVEAAKGIHEISLCYATPQQARLLAVEPGTALLRLDQMIYDQHGAPLHTSHQIIRGDRFTFRI
ncbi:MAG: GntR family transcriptional regulator [Clostridia bacterium]|nr:GntR family transcriptional regulator [Clostridia bacterium]